MANGHAHAHPEPGTARFRATFFLNLGFALVEIVGGLLTNSVALLSDALHDLGDSAALGAAWYFEHVARRGGNRRFTYGYRRFSLLSAFVNAAILLAGSAVILFEAIPRLLAPEPVNAQGMLAFAVLGLAVNGFAAWRMSGGASQNARVVTWHFVEDVLGWAAVLIVSIVLLFVEAPWLDALLGIVLALVVLVGVLRNGRETVRLFLQATPADFDLAALTARLVAIPGVLSEHHTHVWSLDGEHHVLSTHLVVADATTRAELIAIKEAAREAVAEAHLEHVTVEIEFMEEGCSMRPHD